MAYFARLVHGSKHLDLSDQSPFYVAQDWRPPGADRVPLVSGGTMANQFGGGELIYEQLVDRTMNVPLQIHGTASAQTHNAINRFDSFVARGLADKSEKLYFVWGPSNAVPYTPKWGQQFYKYEIKANLSGELSRLYGRAAGAIYSEYIELNVAFIIAPTAIGERQRVGSATGSILEHTWGTEDDLSRGLIIPAGTTNEVANPIFGHSTYDTSWTTGGDLDSNENTDTEFVLFGTSSAKLTAIGATNRYFRTSVNCATSDFTFSVYVKLPDGGAVSNSIVNIVYGGVAQTETYEAIGNGFYRMWCTDTGTGAAANFDIIVTAGYTVYVDMAMAVPGTYPRPPFHGDMLDVAWAGTAHNSDSTSTNARWRVDWDEIFDPAEFTVICAVRVDKASTAVTSDLYLWSVDLTADVIFFYDQSEADWRFSDGTNGALSAGAGTFSEGDILVFACVADPASGLVLYKNGSSIATNATYTPQAGANYLYIGSNTSAAARCEFTFLDFITFDRALSATEISNHYNDVIQHLSGGDGYGQVLNPIPWQWSDDGDSILDGCDDSTHENYLIYGGIPGNVPALTEWTISKSFGAALWLLLTDIPHDYWAKHIEIFFDDQSGTADASDCGGQHLEIATPTGVPRTAVSLTVKYPQLFNEKNIYFFVRAKHETTSGSVSAGRFISYNRGYIQDADVTLAVTTAYRLYYLGKLALKLPFDDNGTYEIITEINFGSSIASDTLWIDFFEAFAGNMLQIDLLSTDIPGGGGAATGPTSLYLNSSKKSGYYNNTQTYKPVITGDQLEFSPNKINMLVMYYADDGGTHSLTPAVTFGTNYITPRWSLV